MRITTELSDMAVLQEIGQRAERRRIDAGLTQAQLAEEAGISKRTLERLTVALGRADVATVETAADVEARRGIPAAARTVPIAWWSAWYCLVLSLSFRPPSSALSISVVN